MPCVRDRHERPGGVCFGPSSVSAASVDPSRAYSRSVDDMVFAFADAHLRNVAGRSARDAGYSCTGSHTREEPCLLTVHEDDGVRRDSAERLIRATSPAVSRLR